MIDTPEKLRIVKKLRRANPDGIRYCGKWRLTPSWSGFFIHEQINGVWEWRGKVSDILAAADTIGRIEAKSCR